MNDTEQKTDFIDDLIKYIVDYIFENNLQRHEIRTRELAKKHLKTRGIVGGHISTSLKVPVKFIGFSFPEFRKIGEDDFQYILTKLKFLEFENCDFDCTSLVKVKIPCSFRSCKFTNEYELYNHEPVEKNGLLYDKCTFEKPVNVQTSKLGDYKFVIFKDCKFKSDLKLTKIVSDSLIFDLSSSDIQIKSLSISGSEFSNKFYLNNVENNLIKNVDISNSVFKSKFEFKNNDVGSLVVIDTNFESIADFFDTNFEKAYFEKCIIEDFIGFEKCEFGKKESSAGGEKSQFIYTTFKNIPNFRSTKFYCGLDIETANFLGMPNFLNSEVSQLNTNRETFRIIKNSFDKVGNHIEANKFFVLEMKKRRAELEKTKDWQEKFVFKWNDRLSGFGQSYLKPFLWLVLAIVLLWILDVGKTQNWIYIFDDNTNSNISFVIENINNIAKLFLPFQKFLIVGMEMISLIFYVAYLVLIWQIIVAVKRHTKR